MNCKNISEGISLVFVPVEPDLVDVSFNSRWIDIGASIHVINLLKAIERRRKASQEKADLIVENGERIRVE